MRLKLNEGQDSQKRYCIYQGIIYLVEINNGMFSVIETYPSLEALEEVAGDITGYQIDPFPALYGYFGVTRQYEIGSNEYYTGGLMYGEVPGSKMTLTNVNMGSNYSQIIKYAKLLLNMAEMCRSFDKQVKAKCGWKSK